MNNESNKKVRQELHHAHFPESLPYRVSSKLREKQTIEERLEKYDFVNNFYSVLTPNVEILLLEGKLREDLPPSPFKQNTGADWLYYFWNT